MEIGSEPSTGFEEPLRTKLPGALLPGNSLACRVRVLTPSEPGQFVLHLALVQEQVAWFDDTDPVHGAEARVKVVC